MKKGNIFNAIKTHFKNNRNEYSNGIMRIALYAITRLLKKTVDKRYMDKSKVGESEFNRYWIDMLSNSLDELNNKQKRDLIKKYNLESYLNNNKGVNKFLFEAVNMDEEILTLDSGEDIYLFDAYSQDYELLSLDYYYDVLFNENGIVTISDMLKILSNIYTITKEEIEMLAYYIGEHLGETDEEIEQELSLLNNVTF